MFEACEDEGGMLALGMPALGAIDELVIVGAILVAFVAEGD